MIVPFDKYPWPIRPEYLPKQHQKQTTEFCLRNPRGFVLNDMGTGKTLSVLWATDYLIRNQKVKRVLICCTLLNLRLVWEQHIKRDLGCSSIAICHGSPMAKSAAIRSDAQYVIINHDGITSMRDEILRNPFDLVIIDESVKFKTASTMRSKAMKKVCDKAKGVWGLTADPTPNRPTEAFAQAQIVNPNNKDLPRYFSLFRDQVEYEFAPGIFQARPNSHELVNKILQPAIRFKLEDCVDIPEISYITTEVPMTSKQLSLYDQVKKDMFAEYMNGSISAVNAGVKIMKLLQISSGWVKNDAGDIVEVDSDTKLQELLEIYESLRVKKLIVASYFKASVEGISAFFESKGIASKFMHGGVNQSIRTTMINEFQYGKLNVLVIQPEAAAHGLTLTAANTIVWHSLPYSGDTYSQANGRIRRIGQNDKQLIINLVSSKADKRVLGILMSKRERSSNVLQTFEDLLSIS